MRKLVIGLIGLSILALPAHAQRRGKEPSAEEIQKQRDAAELDQKYKAALQRTKSDAAATQRKDPWADVRGLSKDKQ
jgi:hypothetical protein